MRCFPYSIKPGGTMTARAFLLAQTIVHHERFQWTPYVAPVSHTVLSSDELTEFAARSVHATWTRNMDAGSNRDYLRTLLELDETQAMEHSSVTFWVTGVSVGLAATISAWPGMTVTQAAFTYTDPQAIKCVVPPAFLHDEELCADLADHFDDAMTLYEDFTRSLTRRGFSRSECEQATRAVLPDCAETTMVVTGSVAMFRYALDEWLLPTADPEIRALAFALLSHLRDVAPNAFQDYPERLTAAINNAEHYTAAHA